MGHLEAGWRRKFVLDLFGQSASGNWIWACLFQIWLALHIDKLDNTFWRTTVPHCINNHTIFCLFFRNVCVPENGKESFTCTCTIYPDYFVSGLTYVLALQFNGTDMWNYSVTPALVGKTLFILSPGYMVSGFAILANSSLMTPEWFFLIRC